MAQNEAKVNQLLEDGESPNTIERNSGNTALHWATCRGNIEIAKLLIRHHADVNKKNKSKFTPLMYAAQLGHMEIVKLLLTNGAKVNKKGPYRYTALDWAKANNHPEVEELLLSCGAEYLCRIITIEEVSEGNLLEEGKTYVLN